MKRAVSLFILILGVGFNLSAGDVAQFTNLGFSADSKVFVFGEYGITRDTSIPFANLYFVDVEKNEFLQGGTFASAERAPVSVGQNGSGALLNLLQRGSQLISRHSISHTRQGRIVYVYINGDDPKDSVSFRDFNTETSYSIVLNQTTRGTAEAPQSAFHLVVSATTNGAARSRTVGLPNYYRDGISRYRMKQVVLSPDEKSLVIVIEKVSDLPSGQGVSYMVETVKLF